MSEQTIARWNAIPLDRHDESMPASSLKRGRPDDVDDDDVDDVSLVSRSPSPMPHDPMDVDGNHLDKYDEYVRGPTREVITVDTKIKPTNKGFALLAKLGWVEGQPVGLSGEGRTEPIPFHVKSDLTGLGKTNQDVRMIETTVSQRRELDSERQQRENEEQRKLREESVARKNALESEISSTLRAFYCTLCDKQFKNVAQYDEHTNSYAHHHKARFKDMQANIRIKPKEEVDKRKEKERKREEKELRKIAAAAGIKMPKPPVASSSVFVASTPIADAPAGTEVDGQTAEPKRSGWASISTSQGGPSNTTGGVAKSGWATVGSSSNSPSSNLSNIPAIPGEVSSAFSPPNPSARPGHNPTFRNAGWTSLDTGSSQPPAPPSSSAAQTTSISGRSSPHDYPTPTSSSITSNQGGWSRGFTSSQPQPSSGGLGFSTAASSSQQWHGSFAPAPPSAPPPPPPEPTPTYVSPPPPPSSLYTPVASPAEAKPVRSNWQQFQKGAGRRK